MHRETAAITAIDVIIIPILWVDFAESDTSGSTKASLSAISLSERFDSFEYDGPSAAVSSVIMICVEELKSAAEVSIPTEVSSGNV